MDWKTVVNYVARPDRRPRLHASPPLGCQPTVPATGLPDFCAGNPAAAIPAVHTSHGLPFPRLKVIIRRHRLPASAALVQIPCNCRRGQSPPPVAAGRTKHSGRSVRTFAEGWHLGRYGRPCGCAPTAASGWRAGRSRCRCATGHHVVRASFHSNPPNSRRHGPLDMGNSRFFPLSAWKTTTTAVRGQGLLPANVSGSGLRQVRLEFPEAGLA